MPCVVGSAVHAALDVITGHHMQHACHVPIHDQLHVYMLVGIMADNRK